jgi:hypothetical protein
MANLPELKWRKLWTTVVFQIVFRVHVSSGYLPGAEASDVLSSSHVSTSSGK